MLRFSFLVLFLTSLLSSFELKPVKLVLDETYGSYGVVKTDKNLQIGSSGIIWQEVSKGVSTIVARVLVSQKTKDGYRIAYRMFDDLSQEALPYPSIAPKKGDKIYLNYLYQRVLPIVPSRDALRVATEKYPHLEFIEPDLFAAYLAKRAAVVPNREDFQDFCKKSSASLIYFGLNDGGRFVDCHSFFTMDKDRVLYGVQNPQKPFYSRAGSIKPSTVGSIFQMVQSIEIPFINDDPMVQSDRKSSMDNFYRHYKSLIKR